MSFGPLREGETEFDRSGLRRKMQWIRTRADLNRVEAENISKPVAKYLAGKPHRSATFTFAWFLKLHKEMFGDVWTWAGIFRTEDLNLGISFAKIPEALGKLEGDLTYWKESETWPDAMEQAVHLEHQAVKIHPFPNGNGRWSRMLADIWLHRAELPPIAWPAEIGVEGSPVRSEYIAAIKAADGGEYDGLLEIHRRFTPRR